MESKYKPTIGLEIHAELNTKSKMFCSCKNDPDEARPNVNICPVCMGHPGTLPVMNKEAIKHLLKIGTALGGKLGERSEFDRKNYFYPDIPKAYQISQYKHPFVSGGELAGVKLTRVHLEEDTARSQHTNTNDGASLVDFNRAGVPLMELVTEPVIHSSGEIVKFGKELQILLQYLGVAEANLEKGEMRLEVNISVSDSDKLGTKVEIKNINSFRAAEKAAEYEIKRQSKLLDEGGEIKQETRGWNDVKEETFSQRSKENSHDYRYFPDPDLPKVDFSVLDEMSKENIMKELLETPAQKRARFSESFGLKEADVEFYINNRAHSDLFELSAKALNDDKKAYQLLSNYIVSDLGGANLDNIKPEDLSELIIMASKGEVSSRGAKDILVKMVENGGNPKEIADKEGLFQKSDKEELTKIVSKVIEANPKVVEEYKGGKEASLQFLVGQSMKESKGAGNPSVIKEILKEVLTK